MSPLSRAVAPRVAQGVSCCFAIAALAMAASSASANELTLAEAARRAVEFAPQLEASRAAIEAASQDLHRAGRLPDPMLSIGFDSLPVSGADAFDFDADSMTEKTIGLRQALPARAKRAAQRRAAARTVELAQVDAEVARLAVARAAASAWVDVWSAKREIEALGSLHAQAQLAARLTRARVAGGSSALDALAAEAGVLEIDSEVAAAEGAAGEALAGLRRWIGDDAVTIAASAPDFGRAPRPEGAALAALDTQPSLRSAGAKVASAIAAVEEARAERRPDWDLTASYGQRSGFDDMLMLEVGVSLPLFAGNRQAPGIAARAAEQRAARAAEESLRLELTARVRAAYARWEALRRQVSIHEQVLKLARDRSIAALASYRAGGDLRPWLDARRDEATAHRAHAQHLAGLGRAWVELAFLFEETTP
ncbi:MAG TPA: TolC family protein [Steroidobacteraceae bacterium]|nr:TolC family protein [Steroidobacteraceae bacterium]